MICFWFWWSIIGHTLLTFQSFWFFSSLDISIKNPTCFPDENNSKVHLCLFSPMFRRWAPLVLRKSKVAIKKIIRSAENFASSIFQKELPHYNFTRRNWNCSFLQFFWKFNQKKLKETVKTNDFALIGMFEFSLPRNSRAVKGSFFTCCCRNVSSKKVWLQSCSMTAWTFLHL